jgi:hypothetical protein
MEIKQPIILTHLSFSVFFDLLALHLMSLFLRPRKKESFLGFTAQDER